MTRGVQLVDELVNLDLVRLAPAAGERGESGQGTRITPACGQRLLDAHWSAVLAGYRRASTRDDRLNAGLILVAQFDLRGGKREGVRLAASADVYGQAVSSGDAISG